MHQAKLTADGARRIGLPHLANKRVEYDGVLKSPDDESVVCADKVYHADKYIAGNVSFTGDSPGLIDPVEAWREM